MFPKPGHWSVSSTAGKLNAMGEHVTKQNIDHRRVNTNRPRKQTAEAIGRRLLDVIVYGKSCRIGGKVSLDDLVETSEIGDWKMPDFKMACTYAASQGWLIVRTIH